MSRDKLYITTHNETCPTSEKNLTSFLFEQKTQKISLYFITSYILTTVYSNKKSVWLQNKKGNPVKTKIPHVPVTMSHSLRYRYTRVSVKHNQVHMVKMFFFFFFFFMIFYRQKNYFFLITMFH